MTSAYGYSDHVMATFVDETNREVRKIQQLLADMDERTRAHLAEWVSPEAKGDYDRTYQRVRAQADAMPAALDQAARVLQSILDAYRAGEKSAAARVS